MQTKLTLRLDRELIRRAKSHSSRSGKSLSALVADFFALLSTDPQPTGTPLPPRVRSLLGALEGNTVTEQGYRQHLVAKHR